ncbi:MAG TPA: tetratricopeptide repeat protein [Burkholderiales bacterium]|nr:tetratricopeptide repeat protein [Burkholderiales bacterium]
MAALAPGARGAALRTLSGLSRRAPGRSLLSLQALFARLARAEDARGALEIEERIWDVWMSDANAHAERALDLATTDIAAERYDIAETRLARLVGARPDFAEAWHKLGVLYFVLGRDSEGLAALRGSLEREPRHFAALGAIGEILAAAGEREGAGLAYRAALRLHPHMREARARLEKILRGAAR